MDAIVRICELFRSPNSFDFSLLSCTPDFPIFQLPDSVSLYCIFTLVSDGKTTNKMVLLSSIHFGGSGTAVPHFSGELHRTERGATSRTVNVGDLRYCIPFVYCVQ